MSSPDGPRGGLVTHRSAKAFNPVRFRARPPSIQSTSYVDDLRDRKKPQQPRSAGGVPAFGKWNERPGLRVIVGGFRRLIGQSLHLRSRRDRRTHSIQQSVEFNVAHRALSQRFESAPSQKSFVSGLNRSFKLYRSGARGRLGYEYLDSDAKNRSIRRRPNVRKITFRKR